MSRGALQLYILCLAQEIHVSAVCGVKLGAGAALLSVWLMAGMFPAKCCLFSRVICSTLLMGSIKI